MQKVQCRKYEYMFNYIIIIIIIMIINNNNTKYFYLSIAISFIFVPFHSYIPINNFIFTVLNDNFSFSFQV